LGARASADPDAFCLHGGPRIDPPLIGLEADAEIDQASAESGTLLLAYSAGDLVGCLFLHQKNDALYISKLAVSPTLQRAGIGRKLVEAARGEARLRGIGMLELETRVSYSEITRRSPGWDLSRRPRPPTKGLTERPASDARSGLGFRSHRQAFGCQST
jgi:GNAT superfamily N-acetyltransferase